MQENSFPPTNSIDSFRLPLSVQMAAIPYQGLLCNDNNKALGQSLKVAGVDLRSDCFSHGQLYVAYSRVSSTNNLGILQPKSQTKNIVYKEVL